jgi:hypothetical protein
MSNERIVFVLDELEEDVKARLINGETPVATSLEVDYEITPRDNYTSGIITFHFEGEYKNEEDWHTAVLDSDSEIDYIKLADCGVNDLDINWKEREVYIYP